MTAPTLTAAEVCARAADEVERRGLHKGSFYPKGTGPIDFGTCPVCLWGALNYVMCGDPGGSGRPGWLARDVDNLIIAELGHPRSTDWSDAPGRTAAEVVAMLRDVAAGVKT